jgi:hypothetical protein
MPQNQPGKERFTGCKRFVRRPGIKRAFYLDLGIINALKTGWFGVCGALFTTGEEKS